MDIALAWTPLHVGSPEWEFGTVTASLNSLPLVTVALALVLAAAVAQGQRRVVRATAVAFGVLALMIVIAGALYAMDIPIALRAVTDPIVKGGLRKAIVKTGAQAVLYPIGYVWVALKGWREGSAR